MKKNILSLALMLLSVLSFAQQDIKPINIYFKSGENKLSKSNKKILTQLVEAYKFKKVVALNIIGNTDNVGNTKSNLKLSLKRANAIKSFFADKGYQKDFIIVKGVGASNPVATNNTTKGKYKNRRVEIFINTEIEEIQVDNRLIESIDELYKQLETPPEVFCIDNKKDTILKCKKGTLIYLKANTLDVNYNCNNTCIKFSVKEILSKSDMILENLTTTSNGQLIESQGMVYTSAEDCNKRQLKLLPGKDIIIVMPTDSIVETNKIFEGNRSHNNDINWTIDNNVMLSNFSLAEIDYCSDMFCASDNVQDCQPCKFFFCRIGRFGKALKGVVNKNQRAINKSFRYCLKELKKPKINPVVIPNDLDVKSSRCEELKKLFEKYGVKNIAELTNVLNKPLLDKYKVKTIGELQDTLAKLYVENIEVAYRDKNITFDKFRYYVFNRSALGWSNIDCFADIPERKKTKLNVNLKPSSNVDCKLVFKNRNAILAAQNEEGSYIFKGIPKNENATIVAIKYEDGKAFLAVKSIVIGEEKYIDLVFTEYSLEELKIQLRILDKY